MTNFRKAFVISALFCLGLAVVVTASMADTLMKVTLSDMEVLWSNTTQSIFNRVQDTFLKVPDFNAMLTYAGLGLGCFVLYHLWQLLFVPMNRIRHLGDIGYAPEGSRSKKDTANKMRRRNLGNIPPPYPNGWFSVLESRDLRKGQSKTVSALGLDLAVFRADDGRAHIIDAYCPHTGANLGVGGVVKGSCLVCPYHEWKFRGEDGKCVDVPYAETKNIPDNAHLKAYNTLELNGFIYIWYHAEGIEPDWVPPELEEITSGYLRYGGRTEHDVNVHIQDIQENAADLVHLVYLHGPIIPAGVDVRHTHDYVWGWASHGWEGAWSAESVNPPIGVLRLKHFVKLFGVNIRLFNIEFVVRQIGAGMTYITLETLLGKGIFLMAVTPVEPMMQRLVQHVYFQWNMPTFVAKFFLFSDAMMVERDIMIWNNKTYEAKPVWVQSAGDTMIAKHRRWYNQFYSENSKRLKFQKDSLDW